MTAKPRITRVILLYIFQIDYFERAKRLEEIPLIKKAYEEQRIKDMELWELQEEERVIIAYSFLHLSELRVIYIALWSIFQFLAKSILKSTTHFLSNCSLEYFLTSDVVTAWLIASPKCCFG